MNDEELFEHLSHIIATEYSSWDGGTPEEAAREIITQLGLRTQTRGIEYPDVNTRQTRIVSGWRPIEH